MLSVVSCMHRYYVCICTYVSPCRPLQLSDLQAVDPVFYNSLKYVQENDPEDIGGLTFSVSENSFGEVSSHCTKEPSILDSASFQFWMFQLYTYVHSDLLYYKPLN